MAPKSLTAPAPELVLADMAWAERLGEVARSIGTDPFYERLLALYGSLIGHDSAWIIRYSRVAPPDVRFTSNVPQHVREIYSATFYASDPFFRFWREVTRPGVALLKDVLTSESDIYRDIFQIKARILDEMGMFFPVIGHVGMALFLERSDVAFSEEDADQARHLFPALEGLHRAHVGRLFYELRFRTDNADRSLIPAPALILDRCGTPAYTSPAWREAERQLGRLRSIVADWYHAERAAPDFLPVTADFQIRVEAFDRDFPLAPEGYMLVLEPSDEPASRLNERLEVVLETLELTGREREILTLTVRGRTTGEIAQQLQISKGTIKNHRLRMYRKFNVTSERALLGMLMPLLEEDSARKSKTRRVSGLTKVQGR